MTLSLFLYRIVVNSKKRIYVHEVGEKNNSWGSGSLAIDTVPIKDLIR